MDAAKSLTPVKWKKAQPLTIEAGRSRVNTIMEWQNVDLFPRKIIMTNFSNIWATWIHEVNKDVSANP